MKARKSQLKDTIARLQSLAAEGYGSLKSQMAADTKGPEDEKTGG